MSDKTKLLNMFWIVFIEWCNVYHTSNHILIVFHRFKCSKRVTKLVYLRKWVQKGKTIVKGNSTFVCNDRTIPYDVYN